MAAVADARNRLGNTKGEVVMKEWKVPVTQENFRENWDFVNETLELIAKRKVIRKAVTAVGNVVFLLYFMLITYGLLDGWKNTDFQAYLADTPVFADVWNFAEPILHHPSQHWAVQALIYILPVYVLVAVSCAIVFGLLWFLYKPTTKYNMTESMAEDAAELYKMARIAEIRASNPLPATSFACNVIFVFGTMGYITGFLMELLGSAKMETMNQLLEWYASATISPYFSNSLFVLIIPLAFLGLYTVLNSIMGYMLMPTYMTKVPEDMVAETEKFYHECNPDVKARMEEEERVIAQANEIQKRRREEKQAFEEELRWKNPIWKKVKAGCIIAIVIGIVMLFGWLNSKIDMDSMMDTLNSYGATEEVQGTELSTEVVEE